MQGLKLRLIRLTMQQTLMTKNSGLVATLATWFPYDLDLN